MVNESRQKSKETRYFLSDDLPGCCDDTKHLRLSVNGTTQNYSSGLWDLFIAS